jgi:hypothetical protein
VNNSIKFLLIFFLSTTQVLLLIGGFNWWVDPYGVYHPKEYKAKSPIWMSKQLRLAKAYRVKQLKPLGIVIGASTSQLGIDPSHLGWDENIVPRYNLSLPGANLYESFRYFQHSHALNPPKQILIGLDFVSFNIFSPLSEDFNEEHMTVSRDGENQDNRLLNFGLTLYSLSAIKASQKKLIYREAGTHLYNGTEFLDTNKIELRNNRLAIMGSAKNYVSRLLFPPPTHRFCLDDGVEKNSSFQLLMDILETSKKEGADVRLFIQPTHAYLLEVFKIMDVMDDYNKWQYKLITLVESMNQRYPESTEFPLWNFGGYNSVTMEKVPSRENPNQDMLWYYDVAHFNKSLGDIIQDRIFNFNSNGKIAPEDFGTQVNTGNFARYQASQDIKQIKYALINKKDIKELSNSVNSIKKNIKVFDCDQIANIKN